MPLGTRVQFDTPKAQASIDRVDWFLRNKTARIKTWLDSLLIKR